jgi:hypothetical protein
MEADSEIESIELVPIQEVAMGCESYGIRIRTRFGNIENFSNLPVVVGHDDHSKCTEISSCKQYLCIRGAFTTWIVDLKSQTISVYKTTIRTQGNEWSEEQAVFGKIRHHISSFNRHYYLQFPFVEKSKFENVYKKYEALREKQIEEASNAL